MKPALFFFCSLFASVGVAAVNPGGGNPLKCILKATPSTVKLGAAVQFELIATPGQRLTASINGVSVNSSRGVMVYTSPMVGTFSAVGHVRDGKASAACSTSYCVIEKPDLSITVFSAPWCASCKTGISEFEELLEKAFGPGLGNFRKSLFVVTGSGPSDLPTVESALDHQKELGTSIVAFPDPKWKLYRKLVPGPLILPLFVVQNAAGEVLKAESGAGNIEALIEFLRESADE